jgi:hypothetical protein
MTDLIEAMARAVAIKRMGTDENWQLYVADQTAALAKLRETHHLTPKDQEPVTAEMVRDAYYEGYGDGCCVGPIWEDANAGWEASGTRKALEKRHD